MTTQKDTTLTSWLRALSKRVDNLERRTTVRRSRGDLVVVFHIGPSTVSSAIYGPDWVPGGGTLYAAEFRCQTAASGTTTVAIKRDGTTVWSLSVASSTTRKHFNAAAPVKFTDYENITLDITAGSGLAALTMQLYFRT